MASSLFWAQFIGLFTFILGIAMLLNKKEYTNLVLKIAKSRSLIMTAGMVDLMFGLAVVLTHNVWANDWRVVVTIVGWLALVKAFFRLFIPQLSAKLWPVFMKKEWFTVLAVIALLIGGYLSYVGFVA